ncbi:MAG: transcriptional regulator MntR [Bacillota bacterium]
MTTPSMEDYLEKIYELIKGKGYARVSDIAMELNLQPSSVTKMVQRLAEAGYINYERYRGLVLTPLGEALGEEMKDRHAMLEEFLRIIGVPEEALRVDVEGIEHHVSPATVRCLQELTTFLREQSDVREALARFQLERRAREEKQ